MWLGPAAPPLSHTRRNLPTWEYPKNVGVGGKGGKTLMIALFFCLFLCVASNSTLYSPLSTLYSRRSTFITFSSSIPPFPYSTLQYSQDVFTTQRSYPHQSASTSQRPRRNTFGLWPVSLLLCSQLYRLTSPEEPLTRASQLLRSRMATKVKLIPTTQVTCTHLPPHQTPQQILSTPNVQIASLAWPVSNV